MNFNPSKHQNNKPKGFLVACMPWILCALLSARSGATPGKPDLAAQRASLQAEAQRSAGWQLRETEHFFLLSDVRGGEFMDQLPLRLEAIYTVFETDFPPSTARLSPHKNRSPKALVRLFQDADQYAVYGGPLNSAGYWSPSSGELVLRAQTGTQGHRQTWSTLNHEAFHQYIYSHLGEQAPHAWYGEGMAEFYGSYLFVNNKYIRPPLAFEYAELEQAIQVGHYAELRQFIHWTKGEYYGTNDLGLSPRLAYAQGCSLIHFLRSGTEVFPRGWQNSWDQILPRYQQTLASTGRPEQALEYAFDGVNLTALENCWKHFLLTT